MFSIILNNYIDVTKRKYISVDDDEFLYSSNMKKLKQKILNNNFHRFYFNEIVCEKKIIYEL